jgi:hypothetical protein
LTYHTSFTINVWLINYEKKENEISPYSYLQSGNLCGNGHN